MTTLGVHGWLAPLHGHDRVVEIRRRPCSLRLGCGVPPEPPNCRSRALTHTTADRGKQVGGTGPTGGTYEDRRRHSCIPLKGGRLQAESFLNIRKEFAGARHIDRTTA
jgi:hypothetical protein